jgi:D-alanyl-D-alanine dipeptidase
VTVDLAPVLLGDPAITALRVVEDGTPLVDLATTGVETVPTPPPLPAVLGITGPDAAGLAPTANVAAAAGPGHTWVRETLAERLVAADASLPSGIRLLVVEGLRPMRTQRAIHDGYRRSLAAQRPAASRNEIDCLASRFVSPPAVAPHVSGAAVDLTLIGPDGPLDLGTAIDATPEQSNGACYFDATSISAEARHHRELLAGALGGVGLVNYPTEWWHWSFGDRYWAHVTGSPFAIHGPVA